MEKNFLQKLMDTMTTNYYFGMYKDVMAHHGVLWKSCFSLSGKLNWYKDNFSES